MDRKAKLCRDTKETKIQVEISLDGTGQADIDTICCMDLPAMVFLT